jgi:hypothetical protein
LFVIVALAKVARIALMVAAVWTWASYCASSFASGAAPLSRVPTWVPAAPWQWKEIPGTRFSDYVKNDGSGIAPPHGASIDRGDHAEYFHIYADGGPVYSAKNHELYLIGGGHAATSNNILVRWRLHKDAPDMDVAAKPTPRDVRAAEVNTPAYRDLKNGFYSDGKPIAFHAYHNVQYLDAIDELVVTALMATNSSKFGSGSPSYLVGAGWSRSSGWRPKKYWPDTPREPINSDPIAAVFQSPASDAIYSMRGAGPLRKLDGRTRQWSIIGPNLTGATYDNKGAIDPNTGKALLLGNTNRKGTYGARFIDTVAGGETPVAVTGAPYSGKHITDVAWVELLGGWVAFYAGIYKLTQWQLILFKHTDEKTVNAVDITPPGAPTELTQRTGMFYDPGYRCLIFSGSYKSNLRVIKVAPLGV